MQLISPDFISGGKVPKKFTCDGEDVNPTLEISGVPKGTKSLALVLDDPDASSRTFTHWIVWNIPPVTDKILPGTLPIEAIEGQNSAHTMGYIGPCPPEGEHGYVFTLYALDTIIESLDPAKATKESLFDMMTGHILGTAELVGLYCRD